MYLYLAAVLTIWSFGWLPLHPGHSFLTSILYIRNIVGNGHETAHLWSLSIEEQFYCVWPIALMVLIKPKLLLRFTLACLVLVPVWRFVAYTYAHVGESTLYLRTDFRFDSLMYGVLLSILLGKSRLSGIRKSPHFYAVIFLLSTICLISFDGLVGFPIPLGDAPIALSSFGLIAAASEVRSSRLIHSFVILGRYSYGIYLWQQLFMGPPGFIPYLRSFPVGLAITFIVALVSFHFVEKPILNWKDRVLRRKPKVSST